MLPYSEPEAHVELWHIQNPDVFRTLNHFHNILRLFDVLIHFPFTTSETKRD